MRRLAILAAACAAAASLAAVPARASAGAQFGIQDDAWLMDGAGSMSDRIATLRIGPGTALHVVDAILSGTHEPGTSHYELLRAFTDDITLRRADRELEAHGYRTHEFGDSVFVVRTRARK